jgi:hypothetical protein
MDEFGGVQESALEYSDTSDENREDAYFLNPGSSGRLLGDQKGRAFDSGESAFRNLRSSGSQSSRIVRFSSSKSGEQGAEMSLEDDFGENQELEEVLHKKSKPTPPPPDPQVNHPKIKKWMTNLAYSFRSPAQTQHKTAGPHNAKHRPQQSSSTMEYPYPSMIPWREQQPFSSPAPAPAWEASPLLQVGQNKVVGVYGGEPSLVGHPLKESNGNVDGEVDKRPKANPLKSKSTAATIAASYLMDYEAGRPPTFSPSLETVTQRQLLVYRIHFSWVWRNLGIHLAILVLFLAHTQSRLTTAAMHTSAILLFLVEIWMKEELYGPKHAQNICHGDRPLVRPLILFLLVLGIESWVWCIFMPGPDIEVPTLASAVFKPAVFFYVSLKARHALEALVRIGRIVTRVLIIEVFLILTFAAVGCQMFGQYESFGTLSTSWLSLFECKFDYKSRNALFH